MHRRFCCLFSAIPVERQTERLLINIKRRNTYIGNTSCRGARPLPDRRCRQTIHIRPFTLDIYQFGTAEPHGMVAITSSRHLTPRNPEKTILEPDRYREWQQLFMYRIGALSVGLKGAMMYTGQRATLQAMSTAALD
jgi:hypothetical protein